jgi:hypothetical protein
MKMISMINKKFLVIFLAMGLIVSIGCVMSQKRAINQPMGWQAEIGISPVEVPPGQNEPEYDSIPSYSPPSYSLGDANPIPTYDPPTYDLTGMWYAQTSTNEVLIIIQSGNTIGGTMDGFNETGSSPDPIAGTIYRGRVEFTRKYLNEWTRYSGVVSGTPDSLMSIQGTYTTTEYPGQHTWTAQGPLFKEIGRKGLPDNLQADNLHRVDEEGSTHWGPVP